MDRNGGFYSMYFHAINHYIYCIKNNISFRLDTNDWLFKYEKGWEDYFESVEKDGAEETDRVQYFSHRDYIQELNIPFNRYEYRNAIHNGFYQYNENVLKKIRETKEKWGLSVGSYDSIFIRRGDKLCHESQYYPTEKYVDCLLEKNPQCKTIFLQTDDYNCFLDIESYIETRNLDIRVLTLCKPCFKGGMVIFNREKVELTRAEWIENCDHRTYFEGVADQLNQIKPVNEMNRDEILEHTMDMIVGVDIVLHSHFCILDNQSNVSRFISIAHDQIENVFDIRYPEKQYDMHKTINPTFE
jgi:hypothetical protein